jgi:hypothetical protein
MKILRGITFYHELYNGDQYNTATHEMKVNTDTGDITHIYQLIYNGHKVIGYTEGDTVSVNDFAISACELMGLSTRESHRYSINILFNDIINNDFANYRPNQDVIIYEDNQFLVVDDFYPMMPYFDRFYIHNITTKHVPQNEVSIHLAKGISINFETGNLYKDKALIGTIKINDFFQSRNEQNLLLIPIDVILTTIKQKHYGTGKSGSNV